MTTIGANEPDGDRSSSIFDHSSAASSTEIEPPLLSFFEYEETTIDPGWPLILAVFLFCVAVNVTVPLLIRYIKRKKVKQTRSLSSSNNVKDAQNIDDLQVEQIETSSSSSGFDTDDGENKQNTGASFNGCLRDNVEVVEEQLSNSYSSSPPSSQPQMHASSIPMGGTTSLSMNKNSSHDHKGNLNEKNEVRQNPNNDEHHFFSYDSEDSGTSTDTNSRISTISSPNGRRRSRRGLSSFSRHLHWLTSPTHHHKQDRLATRNERLSAEDSIYDYNEYPDLKQRYVARAQSNIEVSLREGDDDGSRNNDAPGNKSIRGSLPNNPSHQQYGIPRPDPTATRYSNDGGLPAATSNDSSGFEAIIKPNQLSRYGQDPRHFTFDVATGTAASTKNNGEIAAPRGCCQWDAYEMKRLCKLSLPYALGGIIAGIFELVWIGIIGNSIGVKQANAVLMTALLNEFTNTINYGFSEAFGTLSIQAEGLGNRKLIGQYFQIATLFYLTCSVPMILFWSLYTGDAIRWFGFDDETANLGQEFALPYNLYALAAGIQEILSEFLDIHGHEVPNLIINIVGSLLSIVTLLVVIHGWEINDLSSIGYMEFNIAMIYSAMVMVVVVHLGWFDSIWDGLFKTNALRNTKAVKTLITTAVPLSLSWIVSYGEWEVITILVSFMGPAEVAAWNLMGYIWEVFEGITEAISEAGEVRVGYHMGGSRPQRAKYAAYNAIFMAVIVSIVVASLLIIIGGTSLLEMISPDPLIQGMIYEALPLISLSQIGLSMATVCWAIMGAQGRYRLATAIYFLGSWFITIPLATASIRVLNWNLLGAIASLVVGYTISGAIQIAFVLSSDWATLSNNIVKQHKINSGGRDPQSKNDPLIYDNYDWEDLPPVAKAAAKILGYTKRGWDYDEPSKLGLDEKSWNELTMAQQRSACLLGYDEVLWNRDDEDESEGETENQGLERQNSKQSLSAKELGLPVGRTRSESSSSSSSSSSDDENKEPALYEDDYWEELPPEAQEAAAILGYNQEFWDTDFRTPASKKSWRRLTQEEQRAASVLGYSQDNW